MYTLGVISRPCRPMPPLLLALHPKPPCPARTPSSAPSSSGFPGVWASCSLMRSGGSPPAPSLGRGRGCHGLIASSPLHGALGCCPCLVLSLHPDHISHRVALSQVPTGSPRLTHSGQLNKSVVNAQGCGRPRGASQASGPGDKVQPPSRAHREERDSGPQTQTGRVPQGGCLGRGSVRGRRRSDRRQAPQEGDY